MAHSRALLLLSFIAFVSLGLPDGLLGVAWPSMRTTFGLPLDALGALFTSTTLGYIASSFLSGALLRRMRLGDLLALSCFMTACALVAYSLTGHWSGVVAFGVLVGFGGGAIDSSLNSFAAHTYSPRTVNLLHAFYGLGTTLGPMLMTMILVAGQSWRHGYAAVGAAQFVLAAAFVVTRRWWPASSDNANAHSSRTLIETLRLPATGLSGFIFIVYCALEAAGGAWLYTLLHEGRQVDTATAGTAVSVYWGSLMASRIVFGFVKVTGPLARWLFGCMIVSLVAAILLGLSPHAAVAMMAATLLGFACGPIFPWLIAVTPQRLGAEHGANAIGVQIASAAIGVAIGPSITGILGDTLGLDSIPWVLCGFASALLLSFWLLEQIASSTRPSSVRAEQ